MLENFIKTGDFCSFLWVETKVYFFKVLPKGICPTGVKIDMIRRPTGGRALLHDDDEITYCMAGKIPKVQSVIETYKEISSILTSWLLRLGIELETAGERSGNQKYYMNIRSGADIML